MKVAINEKLRATQFRGQVILAPEALRAAGKYCSCVCSVAAQILREAHDAVEISMCRDALALALQAMQGFARQIFGMYRFFLVRLVAGSCGLKVETESASSLIFKLCQFVELFPSNHSRPYSYGWNLIYAVPVAANRPLN
jgi:hypothetical protein